MTQLEIKQYGLTINEEKTKVNDKEERVNLVIKWGGKKKYTIEKNREIRSNIDEQTRHRKENEQKTDLEEVKVLRDIKNIED